MTFLHSPQIHTDSSFASTHLGFLLQKGHTEYGQTGFGGSGGFRGGFVMFSMIFGVTDWRAMPFWYTKAPRKNASMTHPAAERASAMITSGETSIL